MATIAKESNKTPPGVKKTKEGYRIIVAGRELSIKEAMRFASDLLIAISWMSNKEEKRDVRE